MTEPTQEELKEIISINRENDLIIVEFLKDGNSEQQEWLAGYVHDAVKEILDESELEQMNLLFDIVRLDNVTFTAHAARDKYIEMCKDDRLGHIAVAGGSVALKALGNFIAHLVGRKGVMKIFDSVPDAREWLEQK